MGSMFQFPVYIVTHHQIFWLCPQGLLSSDYMEITVHNTAMAMQCGFPVKVVDENGVYTE